MKIKEGTEKVPIIRKIKFHKKERNYYSFTLF